MANNEHFTPGSVDEQVEHEIHIQQTTTPNNRLVHDLSTLSQRDTRILERARKRLAPHFGQQKQANSTTFTDSAQDTESIEHLHPPGELIRESAQKDTESIQNHHVSKHDNTEDIQHQPTARDDITRNTGSIEDTEETGMSRLVKKVRKIIPFLHML